MTLHLTTLLVTLIGWAPSTPPPWAAQWCPSIPALLQHDWRDSSGITMTSVKREPTGTELEQSAGSLLGVPYSWGGNTEEGLDCSGFVNKVYANHGYDLPRTAREQFKVGLDIKKEDLDRGDLIFFTSEPGSTDVTHVAMYLDSGQFIHAARGKGEVSFDDLSIAYYKNRYLGGRRMLALPVGRYSTLWGSARPGFFAKTPMELALLPPSTLLPSEEEIPDHRTIEAILTEHDGSEKSVLLAQGLVKGAITRVGPDAMIRQATELRLQLGYGRFDNISSIFIIPQFTYFNHANAILASIAVPLQLPVNDGSIADSLHNNWNSIRKVSRVIRQVRLGQKEANIYVDLGRTTSGTIGHGHLMRMFTPNFVTKGLPTFPMGTEALPVAIDGYKDQRGGEFFLDDLFDPKVFGALVFARPWDRTSAPLLLQSTSLGLAYAGDMKAPTSVNIHDPADASTRYEKVHGMSLSTETKLFKDSTRNLKFYTDLSTLFNGDFGGFGGSTGLLLRSNLGPSHNHLVRAVLETRFSGAHFIPSYFGINYNIVKSNAPDDRDLGAKKPLLDHLKLLTSNSPRIGFFAMFSYQFHRHVGAGLSYDNEWSTSGDISAKARMGQNFMLFVDVENIMLPKRRSMSLYLAYHLRNFDSLTELFSKHRDNEFIFASLSVDINRTVSVAGTLRKALANDRDTTVDGGINLIVRYEL